MRRALSILAVLAVLGGLFTFGRYLGSRGDSPEEGLTPVEETVPPAPTETSEVPSMGSGEGTPWTSTLSEPVKSTDWMGVLTAYLSWNKVNHLAAGRIMAYSAAAFFDAVRTPGTPSLLSSNTGGNSHTTSVAVSARLTAALLGTESALAEVESWAEPLSGDALQVYEDVLARAQGDGYGDTFDVEAPSYDGEFAWRSDPSYRVGALEPGWGELKPILFDLDNCAVPAADLAAIEAESQEEGAGESDVTDPWLYTDRYEAGGYLASMAYLLHAKYDFQWPPSDLVLVENALLQIAGHDMSIAVWDGKWENGVMAPSEWRRQDDQGNEIYYSAPSYPSYDAAVRSLTIDYMEQTRGSTLDWSVGTEVDAYDYFTEIDVLLGEKTINWASDVDAGAAIGSCFAQQATAIRSQYE
jgi:hypothetical protein